LPSGKSEEAEIVPPPPGYRPPPRIPASTHGRTFNLTHARLAQQPSHTLALVPPH
jgi:hypothetical protein